MQLRARALSLFVLLIALAACGGPKAKGPVAPTSPYPAATPGPVTEPALADYFQAALPEAFAAGTIAADFGSTEVGAEVIGELALMGVDDMTEVGTLLPFDFKTKGIAALAADGDGTTNLAGMLRDLMVMKDARLYFTTAWQNHYSMNGPQDFPVPAAYGVDLEGLRDLGIYGDDGGGDEEDLDGAEDVGDGDLDQ